MYKIESTIFEVGRFGKQLLLFVFFFISSLFVLSYSNSTSPFLNYLGLDQQIFQYMGYAILHGKAAYTDYFDHKGLLLYVINALGYIIDRRFGIVLLQVFNLTLVLYMLVTAFCHVATWRRIVSVLLTLLSLLIYYDFGNMTEEWSLLFITFPFYIYFKNINSDKNEFNRWQLFYIGICVGGLLLLRLNNTSPVIGLLLYCLIEALSKKKFEYVKTSFIFVFAGFSLILLFFTIYQFIVAGIKGVDDMFYATVTFNIDYTKNYTTETRPLLSYLKFTYKVITPALLLLIFVKKRSKSVCPLLFAYAITLLTLGNVSFLHYLIVFVPLVYFSLMCISEYRTTFIVVVLFLSFTTGRIAYNKGIPNDLSYKEDKPSELEQLLEGIPQDERELIWNYNGVFDLHQFQKLDIILANRVFLPFQIDLSYNLNKQECKRIQKLAPKYVYYVKYNDEVSNKLTTYNCTNSDYIFIKKNYRVMNEIKYPDGMNKIMYVHK